MRILVVSSSRPLSKLIDHYLQQHALATEVVALEAALSACDAPVIVYYSPRWDAGTSKTIQRLGERTAALFVVQQPASNTRAEVLRTLEVRQDGGHTTVQFLYGH